MTVSSMISAIVEALTGALTGSNGLLTKIPEGIKTAFETLFITSGGTGGTDSLSVFATVCLVFGGVALAIGITKLIYHLIASKVGA